MNDQKILFIGCGNMGGGMLEGWLKKGLAPQNFMVVKPTPLKGFDGVFYSSNVDDLPHEPDIIIVAIKPQMIASTLEKYTHFKTASFISIAAGTPISLFQSILGKNTAIIRTMPNTPVAIGKGAIPMVTKNATELQKSWVFDLMNHLGEPLWLKSEAEIDMATAISGSGVAYVYYMVACLQNAAKSMGLDNETAIKLAEATVMGAGAYAYGKHDPKTLYQKVMSPKGTTEQAMNVLIPDMENLIQKAVDAAHTRAKELGKGLT